MITIGIDEYKRSHTAVAVDELGRQLGSRTTQATTTKDHLAIIRWADQFGAEGTWAVEDCRHLSRRLERDMLAAGETIVRVSPKLMAHARDGARSYGKSDPIDALAVAEQRCVNPTFRLRTSTKKHARSACWSITVRTSSPSGPATSTGFGGTSTRSTRVGSRKNAA